jgi:hypothetical protein
LIIAMADFGGFFPYTSTNLAQNLPTLYNLTLLSVFGLGALVGLQLDDPDVALRAFPLSQLVAVLAGFGPLLAGPSNLANATSPIPFAVSATIILFFLAMVGSIAGTFIVGLFEDQFPRSLDWRILAVASTLGLVPAFWIVLPNPPVDSSETSVTLWGGGLAIPAIIILIAISSVIAFYGLIKGGIATPHVFALSMLFAALTGGVGLVGALYTYSFYYGCFAENRIDYRFPPCPIAGDLLNLVIVVGAGMIPSAIVFLGCLFANDAKSQT